MRAKSERTRAPSTASWWRAAGPTCAKSYTTTRPWRASRSSRPSSPSSRPTPRRACSPFVSRPVLWLFFDDRVPFDWRRSTWRDWAGRAVKCAKSRPAYLAERLRNAVKGMGTKDRALIRIIVSRCDIDLANIKQEYEKMHHKTLALDVAVKTLLFSSATLYHVAILHCFHWECCRRTPRATTRRPCWPWSAEVCRGIRRSASHIPFLFSSFPSARFSDGVSDFWPFTKPPSVAFYFGSVPYFVGCYLLVSFQILPNYCKEDLRLYMIKIELFNLFFGWSRKYTSYAARRKSN